MDGGWMEKDTDTRHKGYDDVGFEFVINNYYYCCNLQPATTTTARRRKRKT
jgi:hypothetical protein